MKHAYFLAGGAAAILSLSGQASAQDWQGPYFGGFAGYSLTQGADNETILFDTNLDGAFSDQVGPSATVNAFSPGFCDGSPNGNNAAAGCTGDDDGGGELGLRAGYDWQMGSVVLGVVGEISHGGGRDSVTAFSTTPANYSYVRDLDYLAAARVRLGLTTGRFLPYVTAGYATGNVASTFSSSNTVNSFTPERRDDMADGFQIGGGVVTMVSDRISVGLEYIYTDLEDDRHVVRTGPGTAPATNPFLRVNPLGTDFVRSSDSIELHSFRITAALRF